MNNALELAVACLVLLAFPINLYAALQVRGFARTKPVLPMLVLLSRLVSLKAFDVFLLGIVGTNSVYFLMTGVRLIQPPIPTILLVVVLVVMSFTNSLVVAYLREAARR